MGNFIHWPLHSHNISQEAVSWGSRSGNISRSGRRVNLEFVTDLHHMNLPAYVELSWVEFSCGFMQPVRLGIGPPFGTLDQILSCSSFSSDNYFILRSKAPSLTRKRVCILQCSHSLVRSLTPNHTVPPHLRPCSLFVASYDSQGLRWKYSNPPPHGCPAYVYSSDFIYDTIKLIMFSPQQGVEAHRVLRC
jgi:hypothetical protein